MLSPALLGIESETEGKEKPINVYELSGRFGLYVMQILIQINGKSGIKKTYIENLRRVAEEEMKGALNPINDEPSLGILTAIRDVFPDIYEKYTVHDRIFNYYEAGLASHEMEIEDLSGLEFTNVSDYISLLAHYRLFSPERFSIVYGHEKNSL